MKTKKKRFSPRFSPFFCPDFLPKFQRGVHDSILRTILKYLCITGTPNEKPWHNAPPSIRPCNHPIFKSVSSSIIQKTSLLKQVKSPKNLPCFVVAENDFTEYAVLSDSENDSYESTLDKCSESSFDKPDHGSVFGEINNSDSEETTDSDEKYFSPGSFASFLVHYSAPIFLLIFFHDDVWLCFIERSFLHLVI